MTGIDGEADRGCGEARAFIVIVGVVVGGLGCSPLESGDLLLEE